MHPENPNPVILVVDDQESNRQMAKRIFSAAGFDTIEAQDGIFAYTLLTTRTGIRAVLSDMQMGSQEQDGLTLWSRVQQDFPQLPFLMVTGMDVKDLQKEADKRGINMPHIMQKPFDIRRMMQFFQEKMRGIE